MENDKKDNINNLNNDNTSETNDKELNNEQVNSSEATSNGETSATKDSNNKVELTLDSKKDTNDEKINSKKTANKNKKGHGLFSFKSMKTRKFKVGLYSSITSIFVLAIVLVVNLIVGQLNLNADLTSNQLYTLSSESDQILSSLDQDVYIYPLFVTGQDNKYLDICNQLLQDYADSSSYIHVENKDPLLYPEFVQQYETGSDTIDNYSVIVQSDKRYKIIAPTDLVDVTYNKQYQPVVKSVNIEPQISNAIQYVTADTIATLYNVTGHNEVPASQSLIDQINLTNFDYQEINLGMVDAVPDDCSVLLITTPLKDWTTDEVAKATAYLNNGGDAIFAVGYTGTPMPNLESILNSYGVGFSHSYVIDPNSANHLPTSETQLIPDYESSDITSSFKANNNYLVVPSTQAIVSTDLQKQSTVIEPILTTSADAYAKTDPNAQSLDRAPEDQAGPFTLGESITDTVYLDNDTLTTKIVVLGQSLMFTDMENSVSVGSNYEFFVNAMNWTQDQADSVYISPKTLTGDKIQLTAKSVLYMAVFSLAVLPIVIFAIGFVIWLRRRNN